MTEPVRAFPLTLAAIIFAVLAPGLAAAADLLGATVVDSQVSPKGAFLNIITPGGSVAAAGLLSGDVITAVDGKPVTGAAGLEKLLAAHHPGDRVQVSAAHLGKPGQFTLVLAAASYGAANAAAPAAPAMASNAAAPAAMSWSTYADPAEHAFTIQVPAGWRVSGGTIRKNAIEIPMGVQAVSPDGQITVFYGDPNIPIYSVPSNILAMGGLRQGSTYNLGQGVQSIVMPYMDGQTFASRWGLQRVAQTGCSSVRAMGTRAHNDTSQAMNKVYAMGGVRTSVQAGEASFACDLGGKQGGGYVFAATELVQTAQGAMWDVKYVVGLIAPASRAATAYAVLAHMDQSFAIDQSWMARQAAISKQFDQVVAQTDAAVTQRIQDNGRAVQAALNKASANLFQSGERNADATFNANENYDYFAVRGTSDYVNPATGTTYGSLDNSYSHTYVNIGTGQTMGTDSENSPGAGWQELRQLPAGQ